MYTVLKGIARAAEHDLSVTVVLARSGDYLGMAVEKIYGSQLRRTIMATYIVLSSFTDQGVRNAGDTTKRADAVRDLAKKFGVTAKQFYWTLGSYDVVVIADAPDDASMTALGLAIGALGNVRTQTMRAFSREEMDSVLAKLT